jgi:hypothetical protein
VAHRQGGDSASINRRDTATVRADYAAWLVEQPLSTRTREVYLAAVIASSRGSINATRAPVPRLSRRARVISPRGTTSAT